MTETKAPSARRARFKRAMTSTAFALVQIRNTWREWARQGRAERAARRELPPG